MNLLSINKRDKYYSMSALEESTKSVMKHNHHGCVAVMNGKIIAKGYNSNRCYSNDGFLKDTCSCHAEIDVMRKLDKHSRRKKRCFLRKNKPLCC